MADNGDDKVYSYNMPPSGDARLSELSLSSVTLDPGFDAATRSYTASVSDRDSSTMVTAETNHDGAAAEIQLGVVVRRNDGMVDLAEGIIDDQGGGDGSGHQHYADLHGDRHPGGAAVRRRLGSAR